MHENVGGKHLIICRSVTAGRSLYRNTALRQALEAQEECNENVQELLDGLGGILDFVEMIKKHAQTERLQETIGDFLILLEDVSICVADRVGSTRKGMYLLSEHILWCLRQA